MSGLPQGRLYAIIELMAQNTGLELDISWAIKTKANLRGKSVRERAISLINIAHPDFRGQLTRELSRISVL